MRAPWLAGIADPAWLAVALTALARILGTRDPARALISTLAVLPAERPMAWSAEDADREGAGADDEIDLTGGTGRSGTSTGGLVDAGMTTGPTTTGTSAPADAATRPDPTEPADASSARPHEPSSGRSPAHRSRGLDESPAPDDLQTPALASDEAGGD